MKYIGDKQRWRIAGPVQGYQHPSCPAGRFRGIQTAASTHKRRTIPATQIRPNAAYAGIATGGGPDRPATDNDRLPARGPCGIPPGSRGLIHWGSNMFHCRRCLNKVTVYLNNSVHIVDRHLDIKKNKKQMFDEIPALVTQIEENLQRGDKIQNTLTVSLNWEATAKESRKNPRIYQHSSW
jgi:hypothetical protein